MMKPAFAIALGAVLALTSVPTSAVAQTKRPPVLASGDAAPAPWKRYTGWPTRDTSAFNTLANPHASPPAPKEPLKLDGPLTGDAENGAKLVADRQPCIGLHPLAVDAHFAAAQDPVDMTFRNPFEDPQQKIVDALPGASLAHCKAVHSILA